MREAFAPVVFTAAQAVPLDFVQWLPGIFALAAAALAGVFAILNRRGGARDTERQRRMPSWSELAVENRSLRVELIQADNRYDELRAETTRKINETNDRLTLVERTNRVRDHAVGQVLRDLGDQWPADHPRPRINPDALGILEDTIPASLLREPTN